MTKKRLRLAVAAGIAVLTMAASSVSALAYSNTGSYLFKFPQSYSSNYVRSQGPVTTSGATAYVNQQVNTSHSTRYYLCTGSGGNGYAATGWVAFTTAGKKNFTYNSGYGGRGVTMYLTGYPEQIGSYPAYQAEGIFLV